MQDNNGDKVTENAEQKTEQLNENSKEDSTKTDGNNKLVEAPSDAHEEIQKYKDQALRFAAESENLRKRFTKDIEEANKYAVTKFARDLIEVLENLHRAEASIGNLEQIEENNTLKQVFTGVELTKKSLIDAFEKHGIQRLDPSIGESFNHDFHQAIAQVPSTQHKEGEIVQVIQAGYTIFGRLLRPALVAVAKPE